MEKRCSTSTTLTVYLHYWKQKKERWLFTKLNIIIPKTTNRTVSYVNPEDILMAYSPASLWVTSFRTNILSLVHSKRGSFTCGHEIKRFSKPEHTSAKDNTGSCTLTVVFSNRTCLGPSESGVKVTVLDVEYTGRRKSFPAHTLWTSSLSPVEEEKSLGPGQTVCVVGEGYVMKCVMWLTQHDPACMESRINAVINLLWKYHTGSALREISVSFTGIMFVN